ncbi:MULTISPECIES: hypothetical protein [Methylomicrobium]|uniref:hypothetical protein n=1 Tax=Methylomicrobium TaxID=39773 RepID=UPI0002623DD1|nr:MULTISPECIES: hypothetical protein [Methylomicrobium]
MNVDPYLLKTGIIEPNKKTTGPIFFDILDDRSYINRLQKLTQKQTKRENLLNQDVSLLMLQGGLKEILEAVQILFTAISRFCSRVDRSLHSDLRGIEDFPNDLDFLEAYGVSVSRSNDGQRTC